jgi:glucokinase
VPAPGRPERSGGPHLCLAVDIGGTKVGSALVDDVGRVVGYHQVSTPASDDPEEVWDAVGAAVDRALDDARAIGSTPEVCGIGCGGPMASELVSPLNIPAWREFPLVQRMAERTGLRVALDNDAKALALGEGWCGAAAGERHFLAMVVSTGVGGGIVLDGTMLDGRSGNAGHIGHVIVVPDGRRCACGARGCLEAEASGPAIAAITGQPAAAAAPSIRRRTGRLVGRAVASVANLLDLPLAVVGGSVALGYGDDFFGAARSELQSCARLSFSADTRIVPAGLGSSAPIVGAAAVGWRAMGALRPSAHPPPDDSTATE